MAQAVPLTEILLKAQDADAGNRNQAEKSLQQLQAQSAPSYILSLATELASEGKPEHVRQMAGILMKNALDAHGAATKSELSLRWQGLDPGLKQQIHQLLLSALPAQAPTARHTAALVIAKVAAIELPQNQWPELIPTLLENMKPANPALKQATLETMGYVCEEIGKIDEEVLEQNQINAILTAVVEGMREGHSEVAVRLAATTALYNALEFAESNFENDNERNYIMQMVCQGTITRADVRVREASFECLVKVASLYYAKLPSYMIDIYNLSSQAIKEDEEEVAKQAVEFWCTIAEEELDIREQIREGNEGDSSLVNHNFIKAALKQQQNLVTLLLDQLLKQEEDQDKDDTIYNMAMAAGTCLELVANVVEDDVIPLVMPFVQANIDSKASPEDWRRREAATFAFGCILEGPSLDKLVSLVNMGLGFFLIALKDPNSQVRHTTAWTIGRVFEFVLREDTEDPVVSSRNVSEIVPTLLQSLQDEPHIAEKVCYAFSELAAGSKSETGQSLLSPYFKDIISALLQTASRRPDTSTQFDTLRLQTQAFEAINEMVRSSSNDALPLVTHLIPVVLEQLARALDPAQAQQFASLSDLQGLLCGVLQVIIQRLAEAEQIQGIEEQGDTIMEALIRILSSNQAIVQEEALLAVGALTYALGQRFTKYMPTFYPFLQRALSNHAEWQNCEIAIGVLGDLCRALEHGILQYCDQLMSILLTNLQSEDVQRTIKPLILSAFSDIALAIEKDFSKYLSHVLSILQSAQDLCAAQQQSGEGDSYLNSLRKSIFEAYTGVFQGLPRDLVQQQLTSHASSIIGFAEYVYSDTKNRDEGVTKALVSLLGDLATQIEGIGVLFNQKAQFVNGLMMDAKYTNSPELVESANWASQAISNAIQTSST